MASESETLNPSARIMTFYPTMEEFRNFSRYIAYIESQGAHRAGLAKVVPPKEWKPRASYDDIDDLVIPAPIQQLVTGQSGLFTQYNIQKKAMTVREFRKIANSDKYCTPRYSEFEELERKYWKNLTFNPPIYGADVNGTLYEKHVDEWNIGRLKTILDLVEKESGITIEGVNTPYLYFGMWKTSFAWHTEDMDLYSINYLHFGEPKSWYSVPPEHGKRLERLAKGFFPGSAQSCEAFLRHKMTLISPLMLKKYGIPFDKVTQEAGEFMITFPYGYHAGFNHGFNCAESTNFATRRWIEYGKQAVLCSCRKDMVKISMDVFVRKFQPERYKLWKAGKDSTVIDHTLPTPEAAEFLKESELAPRARKEEECPEEDDMEGVEDGEEGDLKRSLAKHRIGTKRHRVCLEIPQEVSQSELFPREELGSGQYDMAECQAALAPVRPTHSSVRQVEDGLTFPDYSDSTEVKFEELKNVKLEEEDEEEEEEEEEEEDQEGAALDLSVNPVSFGGRLVFSGSKKKSSSSLGSGSSRDSISSDSETSEPLSCRVQGQTGVLTVHSYAKGDDRVTAGESCTRKKGGATRSINERELAEVADEYMFSLEESKKSKGRRQPLSKLPRHHPLVLQDCVSDDDVSEQGTPEEEAEETEAWAKPLSQLWQNRPPNFEAEKEFNEAMAQQAPHCAVCMIFQTYHQVEFGSLSQNCGSAPDLAPQKQRTKPLIPEMCFTSTGCSTDINLSTPYLEEDGTSILVSCKKCSVRVHASCYGVPPAKASEDWMCSRCSANALEEDCCLCSLRGGALQRANDDRWVHVSCAVAILEARFVNIAERSPVDVSKIPLPRFKLKCVFCKKRRKRTAGCCVQCSHGRCPTAFHVSCAQAAGVMMQPDDWPFVVFITCFRHKIPNLERAKGALQSITAGQKVISKHKNGRFYQCEVVRLTTETFYEVNFDDGSFSDNLYPEDIVSQDCLQLGPPAEGEVVQVRWTDGQVYGAKFVASHPIQMYQVEFEDGSQLVVKRDDVYTLDEELPKRVKSRLSVASDMRFNEIFTEKEVKQEKKRQRVINSRYREDYIEPALYRAIME
ncbi:lysine-specific demethylase 4A isoform X1 [Balaenoptera ricei]|uniref:lysine-specific demethylase 4A isoform X1 n=2 Tax=Balaenoptera ricei TaxID=2746895 RepID=UPI0028BEC7FC|nr:lysine-specific demethylase 4A isoform X1 [Balaenoptera ricei]XP_059776789.1 lysine-specific demethylase 4A isoform X1 [Balaenoptera ricei]